MGVLVTRNDPLSGPDLAAGRDDTDHLNVQAKRQDGPLARVMRSFGHGLRAALHVGDPDGSKAAAAGARSRQTEPLTPERRLGNYAHQDGGNVRLTPARRRRILKSLRRLDGGEAASTWARWERDADQRRRAGAGRGADSSFAVLDEVTG